MKSPVIGGEHCHSPALFFSGKHFSLSEHLNHNFPGKKQSLSSGGCCSILQILQTINLKSDEYVLLPSYLCPTILIPFKICGVSYRFYRIMDNLRINIEDIENKLTSKVKALFFINYFGFTGDPEERHFLDQLKHRGIIIIEDCVQSFFSDIRTVGDFSFNSFRKFLPLDGSVTLSNESVVQVKNNSYNLYFIYKTIGRFMRHYHIRHHIFSANSFLRLFKAAERHYYRNALSTFNAYNRFILSRCNIEYLKKQRRVNFETLLTLFPAAALFRNFPAAVVPLGFPILVNNRDRVREQLAEKGIYCPVHWILSEEVDRNEFPDSWFISEHVLTIPVDESIDGTALSYLVENLATLSLNPAARS